MAHRFPAAARVQVAHQPLPVHFARIDVAVEVDAKKFDAGADVDVVLGDEVRDPGLLGLQVTDPNPLLPAEVAAPVIRGARAEVPGEPVP